VKLLLLLLLLDVDVFFSPNHDASLPDEHVHIAALERSGLSTYADTR
jgi:hypothetical protein